jgi:long-chain acyl-CoA synthetase
MSNQFKRTITEVFLESREKPSTQVAMRYSDGKTWHDISWPEYFKKSEKIAAGLASLGVKRGDRVAILSNTRYQWAITDMALLGIGAVTVPIYQNSTSEDVGYILANSGAVVAFIEDQSQWAKLQALGEKGKQLQNIVAFNGVNDSKIVSWEKLLKTGEDFLKTKPHFFEEECKKNKFEDVATIVYTSGTTGAPKGVVLLYSCIATECEDIKTNFNLGDQDSTLTFLPFAHIFGRVELWANIYLGWKMCFAESIDRIAPNLKEIKPTFMMAVPRIFEKIFTKIQTQMDDEGKIKQKLFRWAKKVGGLVSNAKMNNQEIPISVLIEYRLAYRLVFSKINKGLGGNLRFMVSGGAPLAKEIAEFFHAAGVLILEGYGLTETTAAATVNTPYKYKFGTVGPLLGDTQIKFAGDGEILIKSGKVFREYFKDPESTEAALHNGWFSTGDIGELDKEGFLRITDRKKDLIKTAGGKIVAPQKLENLLKTNKYINQVVIYGDKMKYLVALVTLNEEEARKYAKENGISATDIKDLAKDPKINELVSDIIRDKNSTLSSFETIKHFSILPTEFTIEKGELTPSLKVKRKFLSEKYQDLIQTLY